MNQLISIFKKNWYHYSEPVKLAYFRYKYEKYYGPDEPTPKVFIYTPTYNRGEILVDRAIKSVISQNYKNFTYLIVGDCCTDNTQNLVHQINDPRIIFVNLTKRGYRYPPTVENHWFAGPVVAANTALSLVPGDCSWIARIDDDEIWHPDHLESVLAYALKGNYELVTSSSRTIRDGKEIIVSGDRLYGSYFREPLPAENRYVYNPIIGSINTLLYRQYFKSFKFNIDCWRKPHNRVNDIDLLHRLGTAGVRIGFLDKVTCDCLPRPGEETIGIEAYCRDAENKYNHFIFK